MKVIIIEDEDRAARYMRKLIGQSTHNLSVLTCLSSVSEALDWFGNNPLPDLVFSDIQLGDGTSFDIYKQLEKLPPVIFTTAYDEYALKAFKANGIDYLLKPVSPEELDAALDKFTSFRKEEQLTIDQISRLFSSDRQNYKSRFMVKVGMKIKSIKSADVACFYSMAKATYLQTKQKRNYPIDYTLDQLAEVLEPGLFFRVNRKFIINFDFIKAIHTWSGSRLKIETACDYEDEDVVVSRDRVKEFKEWLDR